MPGPLVFIFLLAKGLRGKACDKIAPETFTKLALIAVIAAGAELLRHGFFS